jgi:hypothetical protein
MTSNSRKTPIYVCLVGILLAVSPMTLCAEDAVPPDMQAAIFKKIFGYAKSFSAPEEAVVLIASDNPSSGATQEIVKAFAGAGLTSKAVALGDLGGSVSPKSVVYVFASSPAAKAVCEKSGVLSITGKAALVESGDVAVGLAVDAGKPKIVVHKARLDTEKQELSAKLLQLAKVIG